MIELQTGHSRVLSLVNRLPVGVLSEDARKRVQFTNDAYRRIFGLTESTDDFIGTYRPHAADLKSDLFRDPESFERKTAETLLLRKSIEIETFELADKKVIEREYLPIDDLNGQYQGALWLFRDITEKIHSEEVIASQRMLIAESSKMVALGEMAAGIAHEINNPLAIIQARAALLKEQSRKGSLSPLATQEGCEQIMAVVQRISKIVKGLRSFAREEKDGQWQKASFSELVEDTLAFCRERFKDGGVDLRIQPIPLDSQMDCRPVQISQVLLNLLNNAYDAVLPLAEKWIEIAFETRSDQVQISVCDSGFGVGREVREKIFQPFFTSKPAGSGTGLGLSVSKGIIDSHGGSLALDASSPHTRFVITLPREQGAR
jgi:C4-dicarboxylate-specific signal transduction histidine kinase